MVKIFAYLDFLGNIHTSKESAEKAETERIYNMVGPIADKMCNDGLIDYTKKIKVANFLVSALPDLKTIAQWQERTVFQDDTNTEG